MTFILFSSVIIMDAFIFLGVLKMRLGEGGALNILLISFYNIFIWFLAVGIVSFNCLL